MKTLLLLTLAIATTCFGLGDPLPSLPGCDPRDLSRIHAVSSGQGRRSFSVNPCPPNSSDIIGGQLRRHVAGVKLGRVIIAPAEAFWLSLGAVPIPRWASIRAGICPVPVPDSGAAFSPHVLTIVNIAAREQMLGVTAGRIVAGMAGMKWGVVLTETQKKRNSVRATMGAPVNSVVVKSPVPVLINTASPRPALVRAKNLNGLPESSNIFFGERRNWLRIGSSHVTSPSDLVRAAGGVDALSVARFFIIDIKGLA